MPNCSLLNSTRTYSFLRALVNAKQIVLAALLCHCAHTDKRAASVAGK